MAIQYNHNFRVGDRVIAVDAVDGNTDLIGEAGRVIYLIGASTISVEFDKPFYGGHSENGRGKDGHCRHSHYSSFDFEPDDIVEVNISLSLENLLE